MLQKLVKGQLIVGDRAPLNVYTQSGVMLLTKGTPVESRQQVETLLKQGYVDPREKKVIRQDAAAPRIQRRRYSKDLNPFLELDHLFSELERCFDLAEKGVPSKTFQPGILEIAKHLVLLAEKQSSASTSNPEQSDVQTTR